jgi:tape measure domain-containing protein
LGDVADSLGSAVLTLSVDDSAYKAGLNAAKAQATSAVDGIAGAFRNLAGIVGVVGLAAFTQQVIAAGQASQQTKLQLEALTAAYGEQRQASESVARIQAVLGISATEARQGYAQLYAALRGTGVGAAQLEVLFVGLTKAAIASGASSAEASAGLLQLKQALASGRLQGDELRSVLESLPALTQALASQLGVSVGELKKLGGEGKITSDVIFEAAKKFAGETVRTKTEAENLGVAFANLKEQIAAAIGPGIIQLFAGIAAGVATVARLIEDNAGKIKGFVVATLALGQALAPFAAAILTVRAAWVAYQVAAKAAAVAQAAVLALTGPKGWAVLAAGLGLAAGAAAAIEKTMEGVAAQTKQAKGEYEKLKKEFEGVLAGTNLESGSDLLSKDAIKLQKELNIERLKLETTNERIDAAKRLGIVEDGVAKSTLESILQVQAAISEARRGEREIGNQINAARQDGDERGAAKLVEEQKTAAAVTKLAIIEGANTLRQTGQSLKQAIIDGANRYRGVLEGSFNLLRSGVQERLVAQARNRIDYSLFDERKLRSPQDIFSAASASEQLKDIDKQIADSSKALATVNTELVSTNKQLTEAVTALVQKDWSVNAYVSAGTDSAAQAEILRAASLP